MSLLISLTEAARYLGQDDAFFNKEVRPCLREILTTHHGIVVDTRQLDAWLINSAKKIESLP